MPRVSALIPATRPDYLGQALASVLAQSFGDFEVVVADDSETGALEPLVARFGDPRVRYMRADGRSQRSTVALLWANSDSEFVHYVHDDDYVLPSFQSALLEQLAAHPRASLAIANSDVVSAEGARVESAMPVHPGKQGVIGAAAIIPRMLGACHNLLGGTQCLMIRRAAVGAACPLTEYRGFAVRTLLDVSLYLNALRAGPFVGLGEVHGAYRIHMQQASVAGYNPEYVAGLYEWEIFVRGEIAAGRLSSEPATSAINNLARIYRHCVPRHPELQLFRKGLPRLKQRVGAGDTAVLDASFQQAWREADRHVEERRAAAA